MNELLIFTLSLCLTVSGFELSTGRRWPVVGSAATGAFLSGIFTSPGVNLGGVALAAMAGLPVGYLVYVVVSFIPLKRD